MPIEEILAITMVFTLFSLFLLGFPVAFTLAGVALFFGVLAKIISVDYADYDSFPEYSLELLDDFTLLPLRIWGVMNNFTLLAVPLFVFMGVTFERSGLAERLLDAMSLVFGRLKSGLAISVIIAGGLLAACTGIVGATVVTMGLISLPLMLKRGYQPEFSCGVICAAGTLGQIIPPSIVLILLGDIIGVSVGELFLGAVIPGLLLVLSYILFSVFYVNHKQMPTRKMAEDVSGKQVLIVLLQSLVPPSVLVVAVLGSIFFGIASPTESAAVGAFGALLLAYAYKKLNLKVLKEICDVTLKLTTMVFMILIGATAFGLVFRELGGDEVIREIVTALPYGAPMFLAIVMLLLFVLGCFLDMIEIIFIIVPILEPLIHEFGFNPLWFAVVIAVNLQMSFLTPPLGFSLFYLKGVAPKEIRSSQIYKGALPFVAVQAIVLLLIIFFPELVTWLPSKVSY